MQFWMPMTALEHFRKTDKSVTAESILNQAVKKYDSNPTNSVFWEHLVNATMEGLWYGELRPYFKVWPAIGSALSKVRLDVCPDALVFPVPCIAVRFAKQDARFDKIRSMLTAIVPVDDPQNSRRMLLRWKAEPCGCCDFLSIDMTFSTMESGLNPYWAEKNAASVLAARIAVGVCLLAGDPEFIKPDVLACDREAYNRYEEQGNQPCMDALVAKAAKQGVKGWRVGEVYETIPHFRRPHFALRHTGKGGAIPKIVPVRGSVVHRKKLTDVPTGYLTEDGEEVE